MPCYRRNPFPCGRCIGCRLEHKRQWAVRGWHEAQLHEANSFLTLTYDDEHVPPGGSLDPRAVVLFMKRLRRAVEPRKVSYLYAGEYGDRTGRPHYHACLFGLDFPDQQVVGERRGYAVAVSPLVASLWTDPATGRPLGSHEIGELTRKAVAYVAGYVVKKAARNPRQGVCGVDVDTGEVVGLEPEFARMSRRPAIGRRWIEKFAGEVLVHDGVIVDGRRQAPPRYYNQVLAEVDPDGYEAVCKRRLRFEEENYDGVLDARMPDRLASGEQIAESRERLRRERSLG